LLIDAYRWRRVLPSSVVHLLDGLALPFVIAALVCVDRVLVTTMRPCRLQQRRRCGSTVEGVGLALFVALAAVVHVRAALVPTSRPWIVVVQAAFITWSLTLFFVVVGRCCELRRTARRVDVVRRLLAAYVRLRRHLATASDNSAPARRHLRLLRRQIENVSSDGGFPMTSRRRNKVTSGDASSSSSSSSPSDLALSTDSFRAFLARHEASEPPPPIRVSDCAAADGVDLEEEAASGVVLEKDGNPSGSEPEVGGVHPGPDADVDVPFSPAGCNQQTWFFYDNRFSAVPEDQLLAEIASTSGQRAISGFIGRRPDLRRLWRTFGSGRRRLYEYVRAEVADWLGISGQLRLMTQHPPPPPLRRSFKSRLARSLSSREISQSSVQHQRRTETQ